VATSVQYSFQGALSSSASPVIGTSSAHAAPPAPCRPPVAPLTDIVPENSPVSRAADGGVSLYETGPAACTGGYHRTLVPVSSPPSLMRDGDHPGG